MKPPIGAMKTAPSVKRLVSAVVSLAMIALAKAWLLAAFATLTASGDGRGDLGRTVTAGNENEAEHCRSDRDLHLEFPPEPVGGRFGMDANRRVAVCQTELREVRDESKRAEWWAGT